MNPYVTPLYTILLRSHNNIARRIKSMKRTWSDQRIFKLARKLNTAIYVDIVYNEWAKIVLGENNVKQMVEEVQRTEVKSNVDPLTNAISNEFGKYGF